MDRGRNRLPADTGTRKKVHTDADSLLPRSAAPTPAAGAGGDVLRRALKASGFDAKGWRWPLHEPLFAAIARASTPLRGGNLERDAARRLAREGVGVLPADLAPWIASAPLTGSARAALEQDLLQGHCGHLGASRMPGLVAAQHGRDAAMAQALMNELTCASSTPAARTEILLAGNGHVRRDHGAYQEAAVRRALSPSPQSTPLVSTVAALRPGAVW